MEILDILDEQGNITGKTEERAIVHEKGLWHTHVGIWLMNQKGELLFQKRAETKKVNPNKWTRTGGHVDSGETPLHAIQRETEEEIGVKIPLDEIELIDIKKEEINIPDTEIINRHFVYNYFAKVDYELKDYTIDTEEVSDIKYITIEEIKKAIENKDEKYTFTRNKNINEIIKFLENKRKDI